MGARIMRKPRLRITMWRMMMVVAFIALCIAAFEHLRGLIRSTKLSQLNLALVNNYGRQAEFHRDCELSFEQSAHDAQRASDHMLEQLQQLRGIANRLKRQGQLDLELRGQIRELRSLIRENEVDAEFWRQNATYHSWWKRAYQKAASHPWETLPQGPPEPMAPDPVPDAPALPEADHPGRLT